MSKPTMSQCVIVSKPNEESKKALKHARDVKNAKPLKWRSFANLLKKLEE